MPKQSEINDVIVELGTLLGWRLKYKDEDPINWLTPEGRTVCADWMEDPSSAHKLMLEYTSGYYETRENTSKHSIVISNGIASSEATVVYLKDHQYSKSRSLAFAVMQASVLQLKHRLKKTSVKPQVEDAHA